MKKYEILENYKFNNDRNPKLLESVTKDFKKMVIEFISENWIDKTIMNSKTKEILTKNLYKQISEEYNTLDIPYYYILENINLCIEVELSEQAVIQESTIRFGEKKFSEILKDGIDKTIQINRFSISEKNFLNNLEQKIQRYTENYKITEDSIKIEFI